MDDQQIGLNSISDPRALLEGLFAESPVAFQVYRADGHCLLVNRAFLELFGAGPPPEYNLFEDDILERQGYTNLVRRAFAGETVRMPPLWYDPRDLRTIVVTEARRVGIQPTMFPLRAANGEVQHVAICVKDVTAELDLKRREEELATTLNSIGDAVIVTDTQGLVVRMNPVAEAMTGWPATEGQRRPLTDVFRIVHEATHQPVESPAARVLRDGAVVGLANHTALVSRDGTQRAIADSGAPIRDNDGAIQGVVMVFRDETERRAAEQALRQSEERYRATFEQVAVGVAVVGLDGRWLKVNQRLCDIVGYSHAELLQRTFQDITYPTDLDADLEFVRRMLTGEIATYRMEKRYVRKDGTLVWIDLSVTLVHGDQDSPKYFISVVQDISARKHAEQQLADTSAQLRQSQKMDAIGRLAGGIAHDFNNLLSVVLGYTELLIESTRGDQPGGDELLQVRAAGERAAALTKQLLAFSRQQVLEPKIVDLNGIVANVDVMMGRLIGEHIALSAVLSERPCRVLVDPGQIEQILLNLVVNARDAMPTGGKVTIETQNVYLNAAYAASHAGVKAGPHVLLSVTDTGGGMDQATQERAFEPFFTTKEKGKGTGLGLSTVFGIVKQHGGHIWLWSEPGRGTTFKIYLPGVGESPPLPATGPRTAAASGSETILLVDDDEGVRRVTLSILTRAGYNVLVASGASEAMALSHEHAARIHLLVTDVVMPLKSGPALAAELKAQRPDMAVLYMSGYTDDAIVHHGLIEQGLAFLQKPITPAVLTRKIRDILGTTIPTTTVP